MSAMSNYLDIRDIVFRYSGGSEALSNISFSVKKGEFVGILGSNGSGKTTLLKVINCLLKPDKGHVLLNGCAVHDTKKGEVFSHICTMFQNPDDQLFSATVWEDISFGPNNMNLSCEDVKSRVTGVLNDVGMNDYAHTAIHHLSYGQKKRICLAGVLAMQPEVMLLDEPTSCLDPMGVSKIMHLLRGLNKRQGITMIMSTHSVDLIPLFVDRVIVLDNGSKLYEGTPEEVFSKPDLLRKANLRLPRIGHLFEILSKKDGVSLNNFPLTIGEAREEINRLIRAQK